MEKDIFEQNRESWNNRAEVHYDSDFYNNKAFIEGESSLNSIELDLLGNIKGQRVLHAMCHFGQDSLSMARMGGEVTAFDISDKAIQKAEELARTIGVKANFITTSYYDLPQVLDEQFDLFFTTYGVLGWLPDLDKWAEIAAQFTKTGGRLILVEFHPVIWMYDDQFQKIEYNYFNEEMITTEDSSYTDKNSEVKNRFNSWNHSLSEVMSALINAGFRIEKFQEFNYSPYDCFSNTKEISKGKFRIKNFDNKVPMVYAIEALKPQ